MIQRIQSIYLLLATVAALSVLIAPCIILPGSEGCYIMDGMKIAECESGIVSSHPWGVAFFAIVSAALFVEAIFKYKNRQKQLRLVSGGMLFLLLLYITMIVYGYAFSSHATTGFKPSWGAMLPAVSYLLGWLARRAIKKDEALVKAADRIR